MKTLHLFRLLIIACLLLCLAFAATADVPPLLEVPEYLPANIKTDLNGKRVSLEKRIASLRTWATNFNANCGNKTLNESDPLAQECLAQKAKLDKAGQDYTRDALAFDDRVLDATSIGVSAVVRDVKITLPDGREISAKEGARNGINAGSRVRTGSHGLLQIVLLDETSFTLGPNSDMVLDEYVYDTKTFSYKALLDFSKGNIHFVSGKKHGPDHVKMRMPVGTIGIRGTDFEATVDSDGAECVRLFEGQIVIIDSKTNDIIELNAKQMVKLHADGTWEKPEALDTTKPSI